MTTRIDNFLNRFGLIFPVLVAAIFLAAGCATHPDPLAGWKPASKNPDQAIASDYQDYIQKLPSRQRGFTGSVEFFEDGTGRHAIKIEIGINGTWWEHVLIYDKDDKRIEVMKYKNGGYRS